MTKGLANTPLFEGIIGSQQSFTLLQNDNIHLICKKKIFGLINFLNGKLKFIIPLILYFLFVAKKI